MRATSIPRCAAFRASSMPPATPSWPSSSRTTPTPAATTPGTPEGEVVVPADWVSGSCFLARREALEELGGFDEAYFMYNEDMDLCWRAHQAGWGVGFAGTAAVTHVQGVSTARHPVPHDRRAPPLGTAFHGAHDVGLAPRRPAVRGDGPGRSHGHGAGAPGRHPLTRASEPGLVDRRHGGHRRRRPRPGPGGGRSVVPCRPRCTSSPRSPSLCLRPLSGAGATQSRPVA